MSKPKPVNFRKVVQRANASLRMTSVISGVLTWFAISATTWLCLFALDNLLTLPTALRFPFAVVGLVITVASFIKMVVAPMQDHSSDERVALMLEEQFGIEGNVLINTMQFADMGYTDQQKAFINATASAATTGWNHIPLRELWQATRVTKWCGIFAVLAVLWIGYSIAAPGYLMSAFTRYAFSFSDAPPAAAGSLIMSPAEDVTLAEYDKLDISLDTSAFVKGRDLVIYPAIRYQEGVGILESQGTEGVVVKMRPIVGKPNLYQYSFEGVRRSFSFRIFVGSTYTRSVQVTVIRAARIVESTVTVTPPAYTVLPTREQSGPPNPIKCLPATKLDITIKVDKPIESLRWNWLAGTNVFQDAGDKVWKTTVEVGESSGNYDLVAVVKGMPEPIVLTSGSVQLKTDRKPEVRYVDTELSQVVLPGQSLSLSIEAHDDYGVKDMTLTSRRAMAGSEPKVIRNWTFGDMPGEQNLIEKRVELKIDASEFEPGSKYFLEVRCADFCATTEDGLSDPLMLTVKKLSGALDAGEESENKDLYAALDSAIRLQKLALEKTQSMLTLTDNTWLDMSRNRRDDKDVQKDLDSARSKILANQTRVRTTLLEGVRVAKDPGVYMVARMGRLAANEAVEANHRAFAAGRRRIAFGNVRRANGYATTDSAFRLAKTQRIQFKETSARYVGLVFDSSHGWASPASLERLAIMTTNKTYITTPIKVQSSSVEDTQDWDVIGVKSGGKVAIKELPATLILDLGSEQIVSGLACLGQKANANGQHASTRGVSVYLTTDKPPVLAAVALEQERTNGEFEHLRVVQAMIYNALLELKGQEFTVLAQANDDELSKLLDEGREEDGPSATETMKEIKEKLVDLARDNEENDQDQEIITSKDVDDLSEDDERELSDLKLGKQALEEELMSMVEDLARTEFDFADDSEIKITEVTLHQVSDAMEDMMLAVSMTAEDDDKPVRDNTHNLETSDPALTAEELETALSDPDLGGGMELGQSEGGEDEGVPSEIGELPAELPSVIKELKKALEELGEPVPESGSELDDMAAPVGSPCGDNIDSAAAAGTMTEETPNPMAKSKGRAKEGRAGSADGQAAGGSLPKIPDNQVAMPPRMSDSPSEKGQITDEDDAAATCVGMGKGTGTALGFEKIGKLPKDAYKDLERMMGALDEETIENNHGMMLALNKHNLPATDLKVALEMIALAKTQKQGIAARQMVNAALEHMSLAQDSLATAIERQQNEIAERKKTNAFESDTSVGKVPPGYDSMVSAYFTAVAEESRK